METAIIYDAALKNKVIESQSDVVVTVLLYVSMFVLAIAVGFFTKKMLCMHLPKKVVRPDHPAIARLREGLRS